MHQSTEMIVLYTTFPTEVLQSLAAKHPYTVPALIVFEPSRVVASYLNWLRDQTVSSDGHSRPK